MEAKMRLLVESIEMQGDFSCEAVIRYGDISITVSVVGNELLLPEFIKIPLGLLDEIHQKILAAMCRERRKAA